MVRLGKLVAFVGDGRPPTQAGNLKAADALAEARVSGQVRCARWMTCPTSRTSFAGRSRPSR
jgi:hypothetical protein